MLPQKGRKRGVQDMLQKDGLSHEISVVTPEQVRLSFQTAGLGSRAGAQAIDVLLLVLFFLILAALTGEFDVRAKGSFLEGMSQYVAAALIAVVVLVQLAYFVVCECTMGRTIGGRLVGLRVVQDNGRPVTVLSSLIRNFFRLIDMLPVMYVVGATVCFLHPRDKRIGDMVAGTVVIYDSAGKKRSRDKERIRENIGDGLQLQTRQGLQLEEHQKRAVTREDWLMLSAFVQRMDGLSERKRAELAAGMARHFIARMELTVEFLRGVPEVSFLLAVYEQLQEHWEI
jgi:uncharacterized RDD family membrane protein YckC